MKHLSSLSTAVLLFFSLVSSASAHVIVTPNQVGIAATQIFTVSIPSEKETPLSTIGLRLLIPSGVEDVLPTVEPGWTITTKTTNDTISEIDWTGGSIPAQQRDSFTFEAQAPATVTILAWKAYQTYSDGSVVSWAQTPVAGHADDDSMTPYSTTQVINDLTATSTPSLSAPEKLAVTLSIIGVLFSLVALIIAIRKSHSVT